MCTQFSGNAIQWSPRHFMAFTACLIVLSSCGEGSVASPTDPAVTQIVIVGSDSLSMRIGEAVQLVAEGRDAQGRPIPVQVSWASENKEVATIGNTGYVTAIDYGRTSITASYGNLQTAVRLSSRPASVEIDAPGSRLVELQEIVYAAVVFRDVHGKIVNIRSAPIWQFSSGEAVLDFTETILNREAAIRFTTPGEVGVTVTLDDLSATRRWTVDSGNVRPELYIKRAVVYQGQGGIGWLFWPDVQVQAGADDIVVKRVLFNLGQGGVMACGTAALSTGGVIPLFDFQPYNFSWVGQPVRDYTEFEMTITLERAGRLLEVDYIGRLEAGSPRDILDFGTNGFPWTRC